MWDWFLSKGVIFQRCRSVHVHFLESLWILNGSDGENMKKWWTMPPRFPRCPQGIVWAFWVLPLRELQTGIVRLESLSFWAPDQSSARHKRPNTQRPLSWKSRSPPPHHLQVRFRSGHWDLKWDLLQSWPGWSRPALGSLHRWPLGAWFGTCAECEYLSLQSLPSKVICERSIQAIHLSVGLTPCMILQTCDEFLVRIWTFNIVHSTQTPTCRIRLPLINCTNSNTKCHKTQPSDGGPSKTWGYLQGVLKQGKHCNSLMS